MGGCRLDTLTKNRDSMLNQPKLVKIWPTLVKIWQLRTPQVAVGL